MFFAGDEFGNTQYGNNNAYCQDNIISWLDWTLLEKNKDIFKFFKDIIAFRKKHNVIRRDGEQSTMKFPSVSTHGVKAWNNQYNNDTKVIGVMFSGKYEEGEQTGENDIVYIGINAYWEEMKLELPDFEGKHKWRLVVDTMNEESFVYDKEIFVDNNKLTIGPRTVIVAQAE